jgi:Cu-Zn family superoxide dismutase
MQENPHHLGDLINISTDAEGNADYQIALEDLSLRSGKTSIIGKALVIHEEPDDYVSQPSGNSGKRIACGVIK